MRRLEHGTGAGVDVHGVDVDVGDGVGDEADGLCYQVFKSVPFDRRGGKG